MRVLVFGALALVSVSGCVAGPRDAYFGSSAFYPRRTHYGVSYEVGGEERCRLMSDAWILDNYARGGDPCNPRLLTGEDRRVHFRFDRDGDGRSEIDVTEARFDLRFEHREDGSEIWIRSMPMDRDLADRALDVLAEEYLDRLSGTALVEVGLDRGLVVRAEHPHVVRVVDTHDGALGGEPAH